MLFLWMKVFHATPWKCCIRRRSHIAFQKSWKIIMFLNGRQKRFSSSCSMEILLWISPLAGTKTRTSITYRESLKNYWSPDRNPDTLLLFDQPTIILAAVKDIFYINRIILDLVKDKIPLLNKHLVIFIRRDIQFLKVRETLRHLL